MTCKTLNPTILYFITSLSEVIMIEFTDKIPFPSSTDGYQHTEETV